MNPGTGAWTINGLFALLDEWRHLPAYRLEPRADPFFALFLRDVMAEHFKVEIHPTIIPEMPFRRGTLWGEETNSPNKSVKVDYAVFTRDCGKAYFVELKTDKDYLKNDHEEYLTVAREKRIRKLVDGILLMARATDAKFIPKYIHLLHRLGALGFIDVPADVYTHSFPELESGVIEQLCRVRNLVSESGPAIQIVYVAPDAHPKHESIDFDEFARIAESKGEVGRIFAEYLRKWKTPAGSPDPRTFKGLT